VKLAFRRFHAARVAVEKSAARVPAISREPWRRGPEFSVEGKGTFYFSCGCSGPSRLGLGFVRWGGVVRPVFFRSVWLLMRHAEDVDGKKNCSLPSSCRHERRPAFAEASDFAIAMPDGAGVASGDCGLKRTGRGQCRHATPAREEGGQTLGVTLGNLCGAESSAETRSNAPRPAFRRHPVLRPRPHDVSWPAEKAPDPAATGHTGAPKVCGTAFSSLSPRASVASPASPSGGPCDRAHGNDRSEISRLAALARNDSVLLHATNSRRTRHISIVRFCGLPARARVYFLRKVRSADGGARSSLKVCLKGGR
jgi:hypothetical protein